MNDLVSKLNNQINLHYIAYGDRPTKCFISKNLIDEFLSTSNLVKHVSVLPKSTIFGLMLYQIIEDNIVEVN